jgi:hypothetical protein
LLGVVIGNGHKDARAVQRQQEAKPLVGIRAGSDRRSLLREEDRSNAHDQGMEA